MDAHEDTPRIEVLSDTGRRRRCTDDEKVRIVEESYRDGETVAEVARRHEISCQGRRKTGPVGRRP